MNADDNAKIDRKIPMFINRSAFFLFFDILKYWINKAILKNLII